MRYFHGFIENVNLRTIICLVVVSLPVTLPSYSYAQIASGEIKRSKNKSLWIADNGDGTYTNPIVFADYSDPDVIRVGEDFYMVSSSFNCAPVMPVLHSKDLVNWTIIGHVSENLPSAEYRQPQHGKGCWAPSIRFHAGEFYVYYGDPDLGIYMSKAKNPSGPWEPLLLVRQAKGWIDPCPLWDDDGNVYLVHAWAKSRVGFNSVLTIHRMSTDGKQILDDGVMVFDGHKNHPTIEGPKIYRRNAYYYIFAPAGGVANGWQTVLRAKHVLGPYEDKIVLDQGTTAINGPHQGGWIETQTGESWFVHFQGHGAYGRIVHLQPMTWNGDWPTIGVDPDGDGKGEPVLSWKKPQVGKIYSITCPQTSDEFDSTALGLQWQWHANHSHQWYSLKEKKGALRLRSIVIPDSNVNLWSVPNLLLQKFPAPEFMATTQVMLSPANVGEKAGLIMMGLDYSYISIVKKTDGVHLTKVVCKDADKGTGETEEADVLFMRDSVMLRVAIDTEAVCRFSYSEDGSVFKPLGKEFVAREGKWIGAKVGIFSSSPFESISNGYSDFDWFRINN
ncbi:MAG: glycoside hydrolase 43 family protein [Bacteroidota bacterium]